MTPFGRWLRGGAAVSVCAGIAVVVLFNARAPLTAVAAPAPAATPGGPVSYVLDQFEANAPRVVQPRTLDRLRYLWNLGIGNGETGITANEFVEGAHGLHNRYLGGPEWQFQFYPYTEGLPGFSMGWQFLRRFVANPSAWQTGRVNRMRFWLKVPQDTAAAGGGNHNLEVGTYIRCSTCGGAEDGGGHFYHFYNLQGSSAWYQIIVDTHPNHSRSDNGNVERGDLPFPTHEAGYTYFDLLTRFYLHFPYSKFQLPADFYMDDFELYEETRPENVAQVYSLNGIYVPEMNIVHVGWQRPKNEAAIRHEVRYAFSDIYSIGWDKATPAPDGIVAATGEGGYASMEWTTDALKLKGHQVVYVAIRPRNATLMRQIAIPLGPPAQPGGAASPREGRH